MNGKVFLGSLGGIGAIATGTYLSVGTSESRELKIMKSMPEFKLLAADDTFIWEHDNPYKPNFGSRNKWNMVGIENGTNDKWWKWSYENLQKDGKKNKELRGAFKSINVDNALSSSPEKLKEWCLAAYLANPNLTVPGQDPSLAPLFKDKYVWAYCSPGNSEPVSAGKSKTSYKEGTVGREMGDMLLDIKKNGRLWYLRNKFFEDVKEKHPNWYRILGSSKYKGQKVKDICANAYYEKFENNDEMVGEILDLCQVQ